MTTNDMQKVETSFRNNLGNGKLAARYFADIVQSVVTSRDTTIFSRNLELIEKRGDAQALRACKAIIAAVFPGAKLKTDKDSKRKSIIIKGIQADAAALKRMESAVSDGLSLRDTFASKVKGEAAKPAFDPKKRAESFAKSHTTQELSAFIAALQAQLKTASVVTVKSDATPVVTAPAATRNDDHATH